MKKLKKYAIGLGAGAVGLSLSSKVLGGIGGNIAAKGQLGMQKAAAFLPSVGNIMGAGLTLRSLKILEKQTKRIKRR